MYHDHLIDKFRGYYDGVFRLKISNIYTEQQYNVTQKNNMTLTKQNNQFKYQEKLANGEVYYILKITAKKSCPNPII